MSRSPCAGSRRPIGWPINRRISKNKQDLPKGSLRGKSRDGCSGVVGSTEGHLKGEYMRLRRETKAYVRKAIYRVAPPGLDGVDSDLWSTVILVVE